MKASDVLISSRIVYMIPSSANPATPSATLTITNYWVGPHNNKPQIFTIPAEVLQLQPFPPIRKVS